MSGKLNLCIDIAKGLKELYDLGYYHRDLKPDNIFMFGDVWKIGDLGLVARRDSENNDNSYKIIGPKGWLSPESMNRYLTQEKDRRYDCKIDHQSDVFQLGKIFWFIIQGNVPIGCIKYTDYYGGDESIYALIHYMLNHSKERRVKDISIVINELERIIKKNY